MATGTVPRNFGQESDASARLGRLDGLRGLAAAGVAAYHLLSNMLAESSLSPMINVPTHWVRHWGWTLVDLFFLLSGYVFAHVYLGAGRGRLQGMQGQRAFWVARLARLYPLHLAMLLAYAAFASADPANTLHAFAAHLVMMQGFVAPVGHTFDEASWSLTMELVCYALFAAGCALGDRVLARMSTLLVLLPAWFLLLLGLPGGPWAGDVLPRGLMGFFLGQLLWRHRAHLARVPTWALLATAAAGLAFQTGSYSPLLPLGLMLWPAVLLLALRRHELESRPMLWLGERSYAIYLINMAVIRTVQAWLPPASLSGWLPAAVVLLSAAAILILGETSHRWIENPARRAIRTLLERRDAAAAARHLQETGCQSAG